MPLPSYAKIFQFCAAQYPAAENQDKNALDKCVSGGYTQYIKIF